MGACVSRKVGTKQPSHPSAVSLPGRKGGRGGSHKDIVRRGTPSSAQHEKRRYEGMEGGRSKPVNPLRG